MCLPASIPNPNPEKHPLQTRSSLAIREIGLFFKRSASQTGLNRPVFLPLNQIIPDSMPNPKKPGKMCIKTPHEGNLFTIRVYT